MQNSSTSTTFSDQLWADNKPIFDTICRHPFIEQLIEGSLPAAIFSNYILQDTLYLTDYAKALTSIAAIAPQPTHLRLFANYAVDAIRTEEELHAQFLSNLPIPTITDKNLACLAYTSYLMAQVRTKPYEVALAAVFPCFWIYEQVGRYAYNRATLADHPYAPWLATYSGDVFEKLTQEMIQLVNEAAGSVSHQTRQEMQRAYSIASRLEYQFWDDAYHMRSFV